MHILITSLFFVIFCFTLVDMSADPPEYLGRKAQNNYGIEMSMVVISIAYEVSDCITKLIMET